MRRNLRVLTALFRKGPTEIRFMFSDVSLDVADLFDDLPKLYYLTFGERQFALRSFSESDRLHEMFMDEILARLKAIVACYGDDFEASPEYANLKMTCRWMDRHAIIPLKKVYELSDAWKAICNRDVLRG